MPDYTTAVDPVIGKIFEVNHKRKGRFTVKVTNVSDDWVAGEIVDMRRSLVHFYPSKLQEAIDNPAPPETPAE